MRYYFLLPFLCLSFLTGRELAAQSDQDSLKKIADRYYSISDLKMSEGGKWLTIRKSYNLNRDTILIFSSRNAGLPVCYRTKVENLGFLNNNNLLMQGPEQAELFNPEKQTGIFYKDVKEIKVLKGKELFLLHFNKEERNKLELHDSNGELINTVDHVNRFYINENNHIFAITENENGKSEVVLLKNKASETVYVTSRKISYLEPDPGGYGIMINEQNHVGDSTDILYLDFTSGTIFPLKEVLPVSIQNGFSEVISEGSIYYLRLLEHKERSDTSLVDIWYGNDNKLEEKFYPPIRELFYVWEPGKKVIKQIGNDQMPTGVNPGNGLYFLSFNENMFNDYTYYVPNIEICLYNPQIDIYSIIDTIRPELYSSKNGEYILYKKKNDWCLYHCQTGIKKIISDERLITPYFSTDGKSVMFDGEGGLWLYNTERDELIRLSDFTGYETTILNGTSKASNCFSFYTNIIDEQQPLIIRLYDSRESKSVYLLWGRSRYDTIIQSTCNRMQSLVYNETYKQFCYIEENYNMPPRIVYKELGKDEKILFQSNKTDTAILSLKQEIISYTNTDGIPLKSVLYYPLHYNSSRKYPMVLHIYQVQSSKTINRYPISSYGRPNCDGFDLRLLLEKGYFVYFPDIVYGEKGTGLSALECVNHALDALENNISIDKNKIGLIGHSHGGYETNFIATHSSRFAAYVSGAGNSDIIRSYFSFNYNFLSPFYFQYENGQYEMKKSFSEDKSLYFRNNPIYYVDQVNAPVLLWAGMKDRNIYWEQTMEFYIGLKRNNKLVITLFYKNEGHTLLIPEACMDLVSRVFAWFGYFLKGERNTDWIEKEIKEDANRHPPVL